MKETIINKSLRINKEDYYLKGTREFLNIIRLK